MDNEHLEHHRSQEEGNPSRLVPIRGLTLLLDAPDSCLVNDEVNELRRLHCDVSRVAELSLFNDLYGGIVGSEATHSFSDKLIFSLIPPAAYHVTVLSLFNDKNVHMLSARVRDAGAACLRERPGCEKREFSELFSCIAESDLIKQHFPVEYEYDSLDLFSTALVARLRPALVSFDAHQSLERAREALSVQLHERFGLPIPAALDPHITIGYFASVKAKESFSPFLEQAQVVGRDIRSMVSFSSVGIYTFSDMANFSKISLS